jgi:RNA 2',3'-cyclic 3'-phosphodiesterase
VEVDVSKQQARSTMRVFIAILAPKNIATRLALLPNAMEPHVPLLKNVTPDNLHLTLRFLGETPPERLQDIEDAVRDSAFRNLFTLTLDRLGAFPNDRSPRVLWVGFKPDTGLEALRELHSQLEDGLATHGFPSEGRGLSPHLTLARVRDHVTTGEKRVLGDQWRKIAADYHGSETFDVTEVVVMRSDLSSSGPQYSALARVPLGPRGLATAACPPA